MIEVVSYPFHFEHELQGTELKELLGGKGAGLATMTQLGIPVPPGFTVPTTTWRAYSELGWTESMSAAVVDGVRSIEAVLDRRIGDDGAPLLLSVRSGASISMPGMMDTVLNAGMTHAVALGLADLTGDRDFAWDTYRRAITSFAQVVLGAPADLLSELERDALATDPNVDTASLDFGRRVADAGYEVPAQPMEQIEAAVRAVFESWHSDRANTYRDREGIDHELGTAATVQAMVFGNLGQNSGTGVAFSRDPSSGEAGLVGDFLVQAQGEDVVAGIRRTMPLSDLAERWPSVWNELVTVSDKLELRNADMVDIEFTIENGVLWILQTRTAKRSPAAVFRSALQMAEEPDFPVDRAEAVRRCAPHFDNAPTVAATSTSPDEVVLATGLAASPGRAVGVLSLDPDDAVARHGRGERVVLVREETSPSDVHGMGASVGLVTTLGGMVSHAAVVARAWGLAAVTGCEGIVLEPDALCAGERRVEPGTPVTVCGDSGRLLLGEHAATGSLLPEVETIMAWARELEGTDTDRGDADSAAPESPGSGGGAVDDDDVLRMIALKGMATTDALAASLGASDDAVHAAIGDLLEADLIAEAFAGRMQVTESGNGRVNDLFDAERAQVQDLCDAVLEPFHKPNLTLKEVVTAWQVQIVNGEQVPNDHSDPAYDASVIERLHDEVDAPIVPILEELRSGLPRLGRYRERLEEALVKLAAGDQSYMAHPLLDSYHTVWFELHEELIRLAGRTRKAETEAGRA